MEFPSWPSPGGDRALQPTLRWQARAKGSCSMLAVPLSSGLSGSHARQAFLTPRETSCCSWPLRTILPILPLPLGLWPQLSALSHLVAPGFHCRKTMRYRRSVLGSALG